MKITAKTPREQLLIALRDNIKLVKDADSNLFDRIGYTVKSYKENPKKVTKKDLADLVKEVISVLGDKFIEPALAEEKPSVKTDETPTKKEKPAPKKESSLKKKSSKKEATESEVSSEKEAVKSAKKAEKPAEKPTKKSAKKESSVTPMDNTDTNDKTLQLAKMFSETIEVEGETFEIAHDIKTMEELHKAFEADEEIVFAYYWTKRHLRQFPYFNNWLGQPKSFNNDLDLVSIIYVSDDYKVAYGVSMYTEASYCVLPNDMPEEDGLRLSSGIEFQIYRKK